MVTARIATIYTFIPTNVKLYKYEEYPVPSCSEHVTLYVFLPAITLKITVSGEHMPLSRWAEVIKVKTVMGEQPQQQEQEQFFKLMCVFFYVLLTVHLSIAKIMCVY